MTDSVPRSGDHKALSETTDRRPDHGGVCSLPKAEAATRDGDETERRLDPGVGLLEEPRRASPERPTVGARARRDGRRFPRLKTELVYTLFDFHRAGAPHGRPAYWKHAEEFLSFVDGAASASSHRHEIVRRLLTPWADGETPQLTPEVFRDRCAQSIAAECLFTLGAKPLELETWAPYLQWASFRSDNDTIITFNYDLVLETIGTVSALRAFGAQTVLIPAPNARLNGLLGGAGVTNILKMHGSVDWVDAGGKVQRNPDVETTLRSGQVPLIGTPGPTKSVRSNGHFAPIWDEAEDRLTAANVIVFMGYRFPPSDSEARSAILRSVRENTQST
jgi:hypothetical protein